MPGQNSVTREELTELVNEINKLQKQVEEIKNANIELEVELEEEKRRRDGTHRSLEALKGRFQKEHALFQGILDSINTSLLMKEGQIANLDAQITRLCNHEGDEKGKISNDHNSLGRLMDSIQALINRTEERHIKESNISCHCTHTTINERMAKLSKRISKVC
jgi:predicted  nucleic acid-binding Zn-ribbon protein